MRLVQRSLGNLLADHAARVDRGHGRRRRRGKAGVYRDDGHAQDRRRRDRGGEARLTIDPTGLRQGLDQSGYTCHRQTEAGFPTPVALRRDVGRSAVFPCQRRDAFSVRRYRPGRGVGELIEKLAGDLAVVRLPSGQAEPD